MRPWRRYCASFRRHRADAHFHIATFKITLPGLSDVVRETGKETGVNPGFYKCTIAGAVFLVGACASNVRDFDLPAWATPGGLAEAAAPVELQGQWALNAALSDDPKQSLRLAVERLRKNQQRAAARNRNAARGPRGSNGLIIDELKVPLSDPYGDAAVSDPRLASVYANSILIGQSESAISFAFDSAASISYPVNQAISTDQNINLSFADWEGSQFMVEKNGPGGLILERWILSPDASQLYLLASVELKIPDLPELTESATIGRMFDKVK
jgi:hypothetical protein